MYFAGVDVGSRSAKIAIMKDNRLVSHYIADTGAASSKIAMMCLNKALESVGLTLDDIDYVAATGYGRSVVPVASANISDISAHAMGAFWGFPSTRTVLDLGGQDCKAISCNERGRVTAFIMNDKCAAGSGRFLEVMADILGVPLGQMDALSLNSKNRVSFSSSCAVFAKSEALTLIRDGVESADIVSGLHSVIAAQCYKMMGRIGVEKDLVMSGGVSKNAGIVRRIAEMIGFEPRLLPDPQIAGAIGTAIFAREKYLARQRST